MKNRRKLPSRLCALLLAMALLCSIGIPQAAAAGGSVSWSQVDNDAVTAQLPLQEAEEAAPAYRDTDLVRVSIFLEGASSKGRPLLARNTCPATWAQPSPDRRKIPMALSWLPVDTAAIT